MSDEGGERQSGKWKLKKPAIWFGENCAKSNAQIQSKTCIRPHRILLPAASSSKGIKLWSELKNSKNCSEKKLERNYLTFMMTFLQQTVVRTNIQAERKLGSDSFMGWEKSSYALIAFFALICTNICRDVRAEMCTKMKSAKVHSLKHKKFHTCTCCSFCSGKKKMLKSAED